MGVRIAKMDEHVGASDAVLSLKKHPKFSLHRVVAFLTRDDWHVYVGGSHLQRRAIGAGKRKLDALPAEGLLGAARLAPSGSPFGRSTSLRDVVEPSC